MSFGSSPGIPPLPLTPSAGTLRFAKHPRLWPERAGEENRAFLADSETHFTSLIRLDGFLRAERVTAKWLDEIGFPLDWFDPMPPVAVIWKNLNFAVTESGNILNGSDTARGPMRRVLSKSELMPLAKNAFEDLTDYSVGFIKALPNDPIEAVLAGSGTLVSVNGFRAILTAHHVLTNLPNTGHVGLLTPMRFGSRIHRLTIDMQYVQKVLIAKGQDDPQGPDLGMLVLAPTDWARLPSGKIFYDLSRRQELLATHPPEENRGVWVLFGMVAERTADLSEEDKKRYGKGKSFQGICITAAPSGQRQDQEFDYRSIQVEYNATYEGPECFGGCSGGGLWHLLVAEKPDGSLEIFTLILSGVAFYQSAKDGLRKTIECHGPKTIDGKVIGQHDFSVLDRANLKNILDEHKLTATGLVDPDNAKKLGQFAGVDALILGTMILKPQGISLTAKVVTTDTAEIVGAARTQFRNDDNVKQLLGDVQSGGPTNSLSGDSKPNAGNNGAGAQNSNQSKEEGNQAKEDTSPKTEDIPAVVKNFRDLHVEIEPLRVIDGGRQYLLSMTLSNQFHGGKT